MKHSLIKQLLRTGMVLAAPALLLSSCIDDSYDLNDVDLTVGLGSEGLSVKLGNTEKILLGDILSVDESVKLDKNNLYYLVENGSTDIEVNVDPVQVEFDIPMLDMKFNVLDYNKTKALLEEQLGTALPDGVALDIPAGFDPTGQAESKDNNTTFTVSNISPEIKKINSLNFGETTVSLTLRELKSPGVQFGIKQLRNAVIQLPTLLHIASYDENYWSLGANNTLTLKKPLPVNNAQTIKICEFAANGAIVNKDIVDHSVTLSNSVTMKGDVDFETTKAFKMGENDYVTIELDFDHHKKLNITDVTGRFDPNINPEINPIDITSGLPDFLKDDDVRLDVSNPTIKFVADMTEVPVGFSFSGQLTAVKGSGANAKRNVVNLSPIEIDNNKPHTIYYYQGDQPYDPEVEEIPSTATKAQISNLGSLIKELPDYINVNLNDENHKVKVLDKDYTLQLGHTYKTTAEYDVYVPFEFDKGLTIVYKDSTDSMKDDLKDYAAEGVRVSAVAENTIPLGLVASIEARDINNKPIPGIKFSTASIKAGNDQKPNAPVNTEITIDGDLEDPTLLQKIDNFIFKINAAADANSTQSQKLISTQYLRLSNVRLRLKGIVIADLN